MTEKESDLEELMLADESEFDHVLECVFGIRSHESRTYFALADAPGSTVTELADELDRDRSSINRSLSTLYDKNLVERERRLIEGGGFVYQYYAIPLGDLKKRMHTAVDTWAASVHEQIENFGSNGRFESY